MAWDVCIFRSTAAARRGLFRLNGLLARATNAARACGGGGFWGGRGLWPDSNPLGVICPRALRVHFKRRYRIPHLRPKGVSDAIPHTLQLEQQRLRVESPRAAQSRRGTSPHSTERRFSGERSRSAAGVAVTIMHFIPMEALEMVWMLLVRTMVRYRAGVTLV
jgi:hypothetical protein